MTSRGQTLDRIFTILNRLNEGSIGNIYPEHEALAYKIVDGRLLKDTHTHRHTDTHTHTDRHDQKHDSCPSQMGNYNKQVRLLYISL